MYYMYRKRQCSPISRFRTPAICRSLHGKKQLYICIYIYINMCIHVCIYIYMYLSLCFPVEKHLGVLLLWLSLFVYVVSYFTIVTIITSITKYYYYCYCYCYRGVVRVLRGLRWPKRCLEGSAHGIRINGQLQRGFCKFQMTPVRGLTACYTILYVTILYYTLLYYTTLYHTILYYNTIYYNTIYYNILYYDILYCTRLYCTRLY